MAIYIENGILISEIINWGLTKKLTETQVVLSKGNIFHIRPVIMNDIGDNNRYFSLKDMGDNSLRVKDRLTGNGFNITRETEDSLFFIN